MGYSMDQAEKESAVLKSWLGPMFKDLKKNYCELFKKEVRIHIFFYKYILTYAPECNTLSDEIFSSVSFFPIQFRRKICLNVRFVSIWHVLNLSGQNISADKILGGQNFSADKIFGSKSDFRQFCPPKFCPIRYECYMDFHSLTELNFRMVLYACCVTFKV